MCMVLIYTLWRFLSIRPVIYIPKSILQHHQVNESRAAETFTVVTIRKAEMLVTTWERKQQAFAYYREKQRLAPYDEPLAPRLTGRNYLGSKARPLQTGSAGFGGRAQLAKE